MHVHMIDAHLHATLTLSTRARAHATLTLLTRARVLDAHAHMPLLTADTCTCT